jgi:hypothetical protein
MIMKFKFAHAHSEAPLQMFVDSSSLDFSKYLPVQALSLRRQLVVSV